MDGMKKIPMKKYRIELQNSETLELKVIFVEASSPLEAGKQAEIEGWRFVGMLILPCQPSL